MRNLWRRHGRREGEKSHKVVASTPDGICAWKSGITCDFSILKSFPFVDTPALLLDYYWVGSLDFNFSGNQGVGPLNSQKLNFLQGRSSNQVLLKSEGVFFQACRCKARKVLLGHEAEATALWNYFFHLPSGPSVLLGPASMLNHGSSQMVNVRVSRNRTSTWLLADRNIEAWPG